METDRNTEATNTQLSTHPDVRIWVKDFGPIASGTVDLRPLTVFVGPSNTGKTYFATLVYALHRILNEFSLLPVMYEHLHRFVRGFRNANSWATANNHWKNELQDMLEKLEANGQSFMFSDLPEDIRGVWQAALKDPELLSADLETELKRCFDLDSISNLVRLSRNPDVTRISLNVDGDGRDLWNFNMRISDSGIAADGQIERMVLLPDGWSTSGGWGFHQLKAFIRGKRAVDFSHSQGENRIEELFEILVYAAAYAKTKKRNEPHYLPAARSGIMQSHRVIASSLVERATRAGLERFPELPTFSGVMADFIQQLILYEEDRSSDDLMKNFADALEREVLDGQIRVNRVSAAAYPEFVYQPRKTEANIRLTRASSMVSELAPVVLFLRRTIARGDMLVIEEPEAHLHPAAQTQMAKTLGGLVRAGVRVVVTTHSDWLLDEIGNLIREGELEEKSGKPINKQPFPSSLQPSDVGVWLFRKDKSDAGSTVEEIPFDRIEGVGPEEYADVAEALYNRSASLQNRLAETAAGAKYRDE